MDETLFKNVIKAFSIIRNQKSENVPEVTLKQLTKFKPYLATELYLVLMSIFTTIFVSVITLPSPYIIKILVDDIIPSSNFGMLNICIAILLILQILKLIGSIFSSYYFTLLNQKVLLNIKLSVFRSLLKMPMSFFNNSEIGYIISRFNEINGLSIVFSSSTIRLLTGLIEILLSVFIMMYIDIRMSLVAILTIPFFYLITRYHLQAVRSVSQSLLEKNVQVSKKLYEIFAAILTIKIFASETREHDTMKNELKDLGQKNIIQTIVMSVSNELIILLIALGGFVVLWYSGYRIMNGDFTIGKYLAFSGYLSKIYMAIQTFTSMTLTIQPVLITIKRLTDLSNNSFSNNTACIPDLKTVCEIKGHIVFDNVTFSYDKKVNVLNNLSLEILKGEKIGVVGDNGAGKSTVLYLLLGLYKPDKGSIRIDNQNINDLDISSLRNKMGFISQDVFLFNDTIKNNIKYSKPNATDDEIIWAAKAASAHKFISEFVQGYQTFVGERGAKLSGGQKQKIALARVLLKQSDILIIDEGTSEVDSDSENMIRDMVSSVFKEKTCIIVAHRGATLEIADKIFTLNRESHHVYPNIGKLPGNQGIIISS
ncbi:MAG: ABC transporter ATP-binding protein [Bacteroides sp.]|nr:ABC transporter ATP-binding protein [Bacteroides sp.]MDD4055168.1 ABC transporter ATP-binding protein [Bacteroides sp.]MDD4720868.1 ABC transporter ATP-binding protein [Bacteroides sp.]